MAEATFGGVVVRALDLAWYNAYTSLWLPLTTNVVFPTIPESSHHPSKKGRFAGQSRCPPCDERAPAKHSSASSFPNVVTADRLEPFVARVGDGVNLRDGRKTMVSVTERLLRRDEVERITGLSRSTLYTMMRHDKFPAAVRINERAVGWFESEVMEWVASRPRATRFNRV